MCVLGISLQSNRENEFYSKLAKLHLEKYNFPVEMIICLPNGTVVGLGCPHAIPCRVSHTWDWPSPQKSETKGFLFRESSSSSAGPEQA